jgi:thymidylate synthase
MGFMMPEITDIPVLAVSGTGIAETWEKSLLTLYNSGCELSTQYDRDFDLPSKDATMLMTIKDPLCEPMIHRDMPCGLDGLQEYVMEVLEGIKDHCVRDQSDPSDTRWEYTYHQRLFAYDVPGLSGPINQIDELCNNLSKAPHTRRSQAVTWKVWEDNSCYDPACLQSVWCRIIGYPDNPRLCMNVRFRSNDAYRAAFMNIFALVQLQVLIAANISKLTGRDILLGRYCHLADSYHIYGANMKEFEGRFLGSLESRTFEGRTLRFDEVRDDMLSYRGEILAKASKLGRQNSVNA